MRGAFGRLQSPWLAAAAAHLNGCWISRWLLCNLCSQNARPMPAPTPLCDADITLEKFPGKGGWTYAPLPATATVPKGWFNMARVSGYIDEYALENASLMSMGQGRLFLPVRADIRQRLGKQAGDTVRLVLYLSQPAATVPSVTEADVRACLADVPGALAGFEALPTSQQAAWLAWITAAPSEAQLVARIELACTRLAAPGPAGLPPS